MPPWTCSWRWHAAANRPGSCCWGRIGPPDALQRGHPLQSVTHELHMHGQCAELPLTLLSEAAVADYLAARFPEAHFPDGLARLVHQRTEGNPLFMVSVVEDWVRRGWLAQVDGRWTLRVGLACRPQKCCRYRRTTFFARQ